MKQLQKKETRSILRQEKPASAGLFDDIKASGSVSINLGVGDCLNLYVLGMRGGKNLLDSAAPAPSALHTLKAIQHWDKTRDDGPDGESKTKDADQL